MRARQPRPPSLARQDKLPAFQKEPELVNRLGFEVLDAAGKRVDASTIRWTDYSSASFPFRLRQRPGPQNALGQVKMMFPNAHNVYLHDTPTRELFARTERSFSSGCIRVGDPLSLATWVLEPGGRWTRDAVDELVEAGKEQRVEVSPPLPVYITYFTAVAEPDGSLRLVRDIYDRDAALVRALDAAR